MLALAGLTTIICTHSTKLHRSTLRNSERYSSSCIYLQKSGTIFNFQVLKNRYGPCSTGWYTFNSQRQIIEGKIQIQIVFGVGVK